MMATLINGAGVQPIVLSAGSEIRYIGAPSKAGRGDEAVPHSMAAPKKPG